MASWNKLKANAHLAAGQTLTILVPSQAARRVARPSAIKPERPKVNRPSSQKPKKKTSSSSK
jgi:hypothetical protein